jgi:hypothetical protein
MKWGERRDNTTRPGLIDPPRTLLQEPEEQIVSYSTKTVTLVDIDGGPVPMWEVDAPIVPPPDLDEESDPSEWPAWADNWYWTPTEDLEWPRIAREPAEDLLAPVLESEAAGLVEDVYVPSDEDWEAACEMFREPEPFTPSAADWEDYRRHFDQVEPRYGYE